MKEIRYRQTWFEVNHSTGVSEPKFEAGKQYPPHEQAAAHVLSGIAHEVEAVDNAEPARRKK